MPELSDCPPWLSEYWLGLQRRRETGSLPHALLIAGRSGVGKHAFAHFAAASLLCRSGLADGRACGGCEACAQWAADSCAEFLLVKPEGASQTIKVDTVRSMTDWLQLTANANSYRIALVENADRMNRAAANSLLKTLEEPSASAILILVSDNPGLLPATVRSRCQQVVLHAPLKKTKAYDAAITWLQDQVSDPELMLSQARGAPMRAIELNSADWQATEAQLAKAWQDLFLHRGSVGRIVESLKEVPCSRALRVFAEYSVAASRLNAGSADESAAAQVASTVVERIESDKWFTIYDSLVKLSRIDSASFKTQTVLEGLFADIRLMVHD
ncbi:MAG: hypothetical protein KTR35_11385 [Gammaproteobacteria bacterium]|nr:hypothetical protein [Gammaproteobacteria bacterium]